MPFAQSRPVTTSGFAPLGQNPLTRAIVSSIIVFVLNKGSSCFGFDERESGQKRSPFPPARISGIVFISLVWL
jgi:hypothetical protein